MPTTHGVAWAAQQCQPAIFVAGEFIRFQRGRAGYVLKVFHAASLQSSQGAAANRHTLASWHGREGGMSEADVVGMAPSLAMTSDRRHSSSAGCITQALLPQRCLPFHWD